MANEYKWQTQFLDLVSSRRQQQSSDFADSYQYAVQNAVQNIYSSSSGLSLHPSQTKITGGSIGTNLASPQDKDKLSDSFFAIDIIKLNQNN